ncbi:MAG: hypothetical protein IKR84_01170 [Oscillibacter sp.]|nr:hypothetical protein [Oscillibacter sp.]
MAVDDAWMLLLMTFLTRNPFASSIKNKPPPPTGSRTELVKPGQAGNIPTEFVNELYHFTPELSSTGVSTPKIRDFAVFSEGFL